MNFYITSLFILSVFPAQAILAIFYLIWWMNTVAKQIEEDTPVLLLCTHPEISLIEAFTNSHDKDYSHAAVQGVLYCSKLFEYERRYKAKGLFYI